MPSQTHTGMTGEQEHGQEPGTYPSSGVEEEVEGLKQRNHPGGCGFLPPQLSGASQTHGWEGKSLGGQQKKKPVGSKWAKGRSKEKSGKE